MDMVVGSRSQSTAKAEACRRTPSLDLGKIGMVPAYRWTMKMERMLLLVVACAACIGWINRPDAPEEKRVIGPTETVEIAEASIGLLARVDTGAKTTSVHAEAIKVDGGFVSFELAGPCGARLPMRLPIAKTQSVRSAVGSEERIFVELTLEHDGHAKAVLVNLKDRSHMTYPLLLGRNWLEDDYVVDVSLAKDTAASATRG
jgi:hypothetical protein